MWQSVVYKPSQKDYSEEDWMDTKETVFVRDNYTCQSCKITNKKVSLTAHHILPRAKGGTDDIDNLITLCVDCHNSIECLDLPRHKIVNYMIKEKKREIYEKQVADDTNWRKWVYGGYDKP